jgi:hypothetical protein
MDQSELRNQKKLLLESDLTAEEQSLGQWIVALPGTWLKRQIFGEKSVEQVIQKESFVFSAVLEVTLFTSVQVRLT